MSVNPKFQQVDSVTQADAISALSCAEILRNSSKPPALFTPAILFTHGGFDREPVVEFNAYFPAPNSDQRPFYIDLKKDKEFFFGGLGVKPAPKTVTPVNWDKRLYAISKDRANECFGFLGGIAYSDPKTGFFARVFSYDLTIPDPTSRVAETLTVKVFGVITNKFVAYLAQLPAEKNSIKPPQLTITPNNNLPNILNAVGGELWHPGNTADDPILERDKND